MTDLNKAVLRRTRAPFAHYRRRLVVILEPGDTLAMRLEHARTAYRADLADIYRQLVSWHVEAERRRKRENRKARR